MRSALQQTSSVSRPILSGRGPWVARVSSNLRSGPLVRPLCSYRYLRYG